MLKFMNAAVMPPSGPRMKIAIPIIIAWNCQLQILGSHRQRGPVLCSGGLTRRGRCPAPPLAVNHLHADVDVDVDVDGDVNGDEGMLRTRPCAASDSLLSSSPLAAAARFRRFMSQPRRSAPR